MTLAEHIIEATPERIKRENFSAADSGPLDTSGVSNTMNWLANYLGDVEQLPSIIHLRSERLQPEIGGSIQGRQSLTEFCPLVSVDLSITNP